MQSTELAREISIQNQVLTPEQRWEGKTGRGGKIEYEFQTDILNLDLGPVQRGKRGNIWTKVLTLDLT